jgi:protein transport protein SEC23
MTALNIPYEQVFGYTPDETAFARVWLERETVANALTMVQPALLSYGLGGPPQPALLDVASIQVLRVPDTDFETSGLIIA